MESCLAKPYPNSFWTGFLTAAGRVYCRWFHGAISRPVNGKYRCWRCLREFDLGW